MIQKIKRLLCLSLANLPPSIHRAQSLARHAAHHYFSWLNGVLNGAINGVLKEVIVIKKIKEEMK
ncbi:MAG: hypothetical protein ORN57_02230 [Alphaproteobacteria bacterium]|nr:hypothetical protein [Alphaproteobacteria bacterium]